MNHLLAEFQPLLTAAGAVLSLATFGFILNLARLMRDAAQMRAAVLEERVQRSEEDVKRTEKWTEREKAELNREIDKLKSQVEASLRSAGVSSVLDSREGVANISAALRDTIDARLVELRDALARRTGGGKEDSLDPALALQLGQGYMATGHWELAERYLDIYTKQVPDDWQAWYVKGVALGNSRRSRQSNLAALRSLNESIALAFEPSASAGEEYASRLFTYRGAFLKRLGRLDEAESDLKLGMARATTDYEMADATYNISCVFALREDREQLLAYLRSARTLRMREYVGQSVYSHRHDYFRAYANDAEFAAIVSALQAV